jgi:hypothetical protein
MGKKMEPVNLTIPRGWKNKSREAGISLSGLLRSELRKKLDLSDEEIMQYRSYLTGGRK